MKKTIVATLVLVCSFGYMFVPDKPKAFAEVYRVLRPGGLFLFTTWDTLESNVASYISWSTAKNMLKMYCLNHLTWLLQCMMKPS
jgi:ubiquinone/menaquinone biosynthesis C-methylase UbiE